MSFFTDRLPVMVPHVCMSEASFTSQKDTLIEKNGVSSAVSKPPPSALRVRGMVKRQYHMKQRTKTAANSKLNLKSANNDNAPIGATLKNTPNLKSVSPAAPIATRAECPEIQGETPIRAKFEILAENVGVEAESPIGGEFENLGIQGAKTSVSQGKPRVTVFSNFPEKLPILNSEILLIRGFMGELVNSILANDNEPE